MTRIASPGAAAPVLLYDGVCGFCTWSIQFIIARDRRRTMRFAALQSEYGKAIVARHPSLVNVDSVVYVDHAGEPALERVYVRSAAALRVAAYLGWPWKVALIARAIPAAIRDAAYNTFARFRYRLFGKYESCMIPPPDVRSRFLDAG
jgi:predicted DCC family thiol-disulfide oxidoreductase YuxK